MRKSPFSEFERKPTILNGNTLGFPQFVQENDELLFYISWSHHKSTRPCSSSLKSNW